MSKIQDLRNPKRTILSRLPSRTSTLDRLVDGYAALGSMIGYSIAAYLFLMATMLVYAIFLGLGAVLPSLLKQIIGIPYALMQIPLKDIIGVLASAAFVVVLYVVHCAYMARGASPETRGRRILTADQALRSATKQSTNPASGKSKIRPQP